MMARQITLFSSPISDCSARLRIALNLKQLDYDLTTVYLHNMQNRSTDYEKINPGMTVPTLIVKQEEESGQWTEFTLTQSIAALEYLDEAIPTSFQLLPPSEKARERALVRTLVGIVATDIHPLTTHRVGRIIPKLFPGPDSQSAERNGNCKWDLYWITAGLSSYEAAVEKTAGTYSVGDRITLADVCLVPELWTAERLGLQLSDFPTVARIYGSLLAVDAIVKARQDPKAELGTDSPSNSAS